MTKGSYNLSVHSNRGELDIGEYSNVYHSYISEWNKAYILVSFPLCSVKQPFKKKFYNKTVRIT